MYKTLRSASCKNVMYGNMYPTLRMTTCIKRYGWQHVSNVMYGNIYHTLC